MPIFEYICGDCGKEFELIILPNENITPRCPKCDSHNLSKKIPLASIRPKGIPKGKGGFKVPECMNRERK